MVTYKKLAPPSFAMVMPLYSAPCSERSTTTIAEEPPFHPETVPSSLAKINFAGLPVPGITKSVVALKTCPVGLPDARYMRRN